MATRKWKNGQTTTSKTLHRKLKIMQHEPPKFGGEFRCSGRVGSFCSSSDTRRGHVTVQRHECHLVWKSC